MLAGVIGRQGSVSASYIVDEGFEGTGTPSSWEQVNGVNFDYTTLPLTGSQSAYLPTNSSQPSMTLTTDAVSGDLYLHFEFKTTTITASYKTILKVYNGATQAYSVGISSSNARMYCGGSALTGSYTFSQNTLYHVWIELNPEANSGKVYISTDESKPATALITHSSTSYQPSINKFTWTDDGFQGAGTYTVFDQVILDDANFTTVP